MKAGATLPHTEFPMRLAALILLAPFVLTGCSTSFNATPSGPLTTGSSSAMKGSLYGGQQAIVNAHVYMFAADTLAYGNASDSLILSDSTDAYPSTADTNGNYYVSTDSNGTFLLAAGEYSCTAGQQVYMYATGGNPGGGSNTAAALMAVLGNCNGDGTFPNISYVTINEVSTIAAAYALSGYAVDATHVADAEGDATHIAAGSSAITLAHNGLANAFNTAANLFNVSAGGGALAKIPAGNGTVPQTRINTLANILAACVNTSSSTSVPCTTLFANTKNAASVAPTDTATAAINLAHSPGPSTAGMTALYGLPSTQPPFAPALTAKPKDFAIGIKFTGNSTIGTYSVAIDAEGNAWLANTTSLSELSPTGVVLSGTNGFGSTTLQDVEGLAIDPNNGNIWTGDAVGSLEQFSSAGVMNPSSPFAIVPNPSGESYLGVSVDLNGNVWVANGLGGNVIETNSAGTILSNPPYVPSGGGPEALLPLVNGNIWSVNYNYLSLLSPAGVDITPSNIPTDNDAADSGTGVLDSSGNVWLTQQGFLVELGPDGTELSPAGTGYVGGGDDTTTTSGTMTIDGNNVLWIANYYKNTLSAFSTTTKKFLTTTTGLGSGTISEPESVAIDGSGNIWVATQTAINGYPLFDEGVTELIGMATPAVTPITPGNIGRP